MAIFNGTKAFISYGVHRSVKCLGICLILFVFTLSIGLQTVANDQCSQVFTNEKISAYEKRNIEIAKKYPALKELLSDPQKFMQKFKERFAEQKMMNPDRPYDFDFSEWSVPLFSEMKTMLVVKRQEVSNKVQDLKSNHFTKWWNKKIIADSELGLLYFDQLLSELEAYTQKGKVNYRETFELSYFYSRAVGLFDLNLLKQLNFRDKLFLKLDKFTEGFKELSVQKEYEHYLQRKVVLFDKKSPISTWEIAAQPFKDAIFNKDNLEILVLPTTQSLGPSVFMHLLSSDIYLVGVTTTPVPADGYVRPSNLFFLHDLRHSSFMYYCNLLYREKHNLTHEQVNALSRFMAELVEEMDAELKAIEDKDLVRAIRYYLFNQHHDGGYKFAPSNYLTNNAYHAPFILYVQLVISGQRPKFSSIKDIARARQWLEGFWLKRVAAEKELINRMKSSER